MPLFGEYETSDEPVWIREEPGFVATVWKARLSGGRDGRVYAIKCFAPRRHQTTTAEAAPQETLDEDRGLEFIESVKVLKKAGHENGRGLAPIYGFGTSEIGVWYATDYYQRKTLKEFIRLQGGVESKALEHVVYSMVTGCLALQRATGRSHGNLKASNVLLAGKPQLLRKTPLHLIDPRPTALLRTAAADSGNGPGAASKQVAESQDLRAIGEVILQLVEGRTIENAYDYNYPIAPSPAWNNLGKDAERWRQLCNRLLNPQLSLAEVSLESLAKDFRASASGMTMAQILAVAGGGVAVALMALLVYSFGRHAPEENRRSTQTTRPGANDQARQGELIRLVNAAQQASQAKQWTTAADLWSQALRQADALPDPQQRPTLEKERDYAMALDAGLRFLRQGQADQAKLQAGKAAALKPGDANAAELSAQADGALKSLAEDAKRKDLAQFLGSGKRANQSKDWLAATNALGQAFRLAQELNDQPAMQSARGELEYAQAMDSGEKFFHDHKLQEAITQAKRALQQKTDDYAANDLLSRAQLQSQIDLNTADHQKKRQEFDEFLANGQRGSQKREWSTALSALRQALDRADGLNDEGRRRTARSELDYAQAMNTGEALVSQGSPGKALDEVAKALKIKANDPAALDLQQRAQAANTQLAQKLEHDKQRVELAGWLNEGRQSAQRQDWNRAIGYWTKALPRANELKDSDSARTAKLELDFATAMANGAALLPDKPAEAAKEFDKALLLKPGNTLASIAKEKAEAASDQQRQAQELRRKQTDLEDTLLAATESVRKKEWPKAADSLRLAQQKATELHDTNLLSTLRVERPYVESMAAGEKFYSSNQIEQARQQADQALVLKPKDQAANDLLRRCRQATLEKQRHEMIATLAAGENAIQQKDWPGATNLLSQAVQQADELKETSRSQSAANALAFARSMDAGQRLFNQEQFPEAEQQVKKALQLRANDRAALDLASSIEKALQHRQDLAKAAERQQHYAAALQSSRDALQRQNYDEAITQADLALNLVHNDAQATDLKRAAQAERSQWQELQKSFKEGRYEGVLTSPWPDKPPFHALTDQARQENSLLQDVGKQFARGEYAFVERLESQSLRSKPPFAALIEAGRKEQGELRSLDELRNRNDWRGVEQRYAKLAPQIQNKKPFNDLSAWAQSQSSAQTAGAGRKELHMDLAQREKLLSYWESLPQLHKQGSLSTPLKTFCLAKLQDLETAYDSEGQLNRETKNRIEALRRQIQGGRGEVVSPRTGVSPFGVNPNPEQVIPGRIR